MKTEIAQMLCALYANHGNLEEYSDVLRHIGLILEKQTYKSNNLSQYKNLLPESMIYLDLSDQEQYVCVYTLWAFAKCKGVDHSIIWALGKARWTLNLEFLVDLIQDVNPENETIVHQSFMSLGGILTGDKDSDDYKSQMAIMNQPKLIYWLRLVNDLTGTQTINDLVKKILSFLSLR